MATEHTPTSARPKALVFGWDAADHALVSGWLGKGLLPNLDRVTAGGFGAMRSVPNLNSAPAWTTITTGLGPGNHGIYWFTKPEQDGYSYRVASAADRHGRPLWGLASDAGLRVGVMHVPMTYP